MRSDVVRLLVVVGACAALACGGEERDGGKPAAGFSREEPVEPAPTTILKHALSTTAEGVRVVSVDVLLHGMPTEAVARASLQHVIDSVAAADSLVTVVRAAGFMVGTPDTSGVAAVDPVITAVWAPADSSVRSRTGAAVFRTHFIILRPFATGAGNTPPQ